MLLEEVSKEESNVVLSSFKQDKGPMPNEMLVEFYEGFYDLQEYDLLRVVEEVKRLRKVLGTFNSIVLALTPKRIILKVLKNSSQYPFVTIYKYWQKSW